MDRREFLTTVAAGGLACSQTGRQGILGAAETRPKAPPLAMRRLGRSGIDVTLLALGGFTGMKEVPSGKFDPVEMAHAAIDSGLRYFDSAPSYGSGQSEKNYGEVLAQRRGEVFLAAKTGQRTYDGSMREFETTLKRLRTDHVDLLQIHGARANEDLAAWGKPDGVMKALQKLRDQKATRLIGVTGHESADVMCRAISLYEFDTVLTTFNPTPKRRPFIEKVIPLALEKKMGILAMKVMGGALGSLAVGNPPKNDGAANHDDAPQQAEPELLIRYALSLPVTVAIVGSGSLAQLRVNVAAARNFRPLTEPERKALEARMGAAG